MTSFCRIVFLLFFLGVGNGSSMTPNVPWITRENGERFLAAFTKAMWAYEELQQEGINDLESVFEALLGLIPETPKKLSVAKLQAINMAFAAIIAEIVTIDGRGSVEEKTEVLSKSLDQAFLSTSGVINTDLKKEILNLTELFSEDSGTQQNFPEEEYSGFTSLGEYGTLNAVTSTQQSTSASVAAQSSSTVSTAQTQGTTSSISLTYVASASEASSVFTQFLTSSLIENPGFILHFNSIASSAAASAYASTSAEATAYSIGQGGIASVIGSAVSQATAGVPIMAGPFAFVQAFASAVAQKLSSCDVLTLGNAVELAKKFENSLVTAMSSASVSSDVSATTGWKSVGSQIHTTSGAFASSYGSSGASYGLPFGAESPLLPAFGAGDGLNNVDFLPPSPGISPVSIPSFTELSPYLPLISELLSSPSGLTSTSANQRIASLMPSLVLAVTGNGFNASLFSSTLSSLVSQISQNAGLSPSQIVTEAILEVIFALLQILSSAKLGVVSTASQHATISDIAQSVLSSLNALSIY